MTKSSIHSMLSNAAKHFEAKNLKEARVSLSKIINLDPNNLPALQMLGLLSALENRAEQSIDFFKRAIKISPNESSIHLNLAQTFYDAGEYRSSESSIKNALIIDPKNFLAYSKLGLLYSKIKEYELALNAFNEAVSINPHLADTWSNMGATLNCLQRHEEALACFDKALSINPNHAEPWSNLGNTLNNLNRSEEALACFDKALSINPNHAEPWSNLGNTLNNLNRSEEALACFDRALSINPNYADAWSNKGATLNVLKQYTDALACFDKVLSINPNNADAWSNKGATLNELKQYTEALACFDKALSINPNYADAWFNKGITFYELKHYEGAFTCYKMAISINQDHGEAILSLGILELSLQLFKEGWIHYEKRWMSKNCDSHRLVTNKKNWTGLISSNKILVWGEQGIGDQLLFGSILGDLKKCPQKIIITIDKKLLSIFTRSFPEYEFINKESLIAEEIYDEYIPMGSLGGIFRNSLDDFQKASYPYILDDLIRTESIKSRAEFKNKVTCGVSWGSINRKIGDDKSIPIRDLYPILKMSNIKFVNLQYGDTKSTLLQVKEEIGKEILNIDEIDLFKDVDGALSIIAACDIVVTSSNSTAHLAGALGKETLLIVPFSAGRLWYWHENAGNSIWYPSVKVFGQEQQGDWSAPVGAVKQYLESRFG